jgi:diguanylate cyclase (GGDEF)-like protein/PAS domain S-box-containing protein
MIHRSRQYRPFARSGRGMIVAIFITFGLISALSVTLSIRATNRSKNRAAVVEVVARQRTLAERYVKEVLELRAGLAADPALTASELAGSARALLDGGATPAVNGDDDATIVPAATGADVRRQLMQEQRLVRDLNAVGNAVLAHKPLSTVPATAGEDIRAANPLQRLTILGDLTSNVALNTARTVATQADQNISDLIVTQIALGIGGLLVSLLLAWGLVATIRRQNAHFRSLVTSSSELVVVLGSGGCRYASRSLCAMVGRPEPDLLGEGFAQFVREDDREALGHAQRTGEPSELMLRVRNSDGEWRNLEAHITDLRQDRNLRGVVVNARDVTERVRLQRELMLQTQRDTFGSELNEALEMADEEQAAYEVIERAMIEISTELPMELLLSDSSRAHLESAASSLTAGAPGCPVQSPFSCVAVRRGQPVEFESSEALNACPMLRNRPGGACSAACVPVSFMGRALGVLHATGPDGTPPSSEEVAQLTTLATQAGARIGTVRAFEKTQLQAATDSLTGLVNRRTFERQVRRLIRERRPFALAVADLDSFKAINDTHGHGAGDRALRLFAQVARAALREADIFGRWGGEEFVFALPDIDRDKAVEVLDRIRAKLAEAHTGDHPRFTASFGATDSGQAATIEELVQIADSGLYQSKHEGRDRVTLGEPDLADRSVLGDHGDEDSIGAEPARRGRSGPSLHDAEDDEDPRPSGVEIR